ncbi:Hypothetical protein R9X50_00648100 [Acrodontium crateriforme]|uniref:Metallo-beta-lactamase domain-containing protein n=1 Tax=Acrodontium crateriforme TaxID=150365 RepID=A0AAQ3R9X1_9PEZI|nr:Hypothetical protein R9X50_00648100 [Acrodontium crateriforme]
MALRIPFDYGFWGDYLGGQSASLPVLPVVTDMNHRVIRILGGNPGSMQLQGTNTYLVGTSYQKILIDTGDGTPSWINEVIKVVSSRNIEITAVLLTHWHGDHTGGVPDLIEYDSKIATRVFKNMPDEGQKDIRDGDIFRVEGASLRAIFTPGHAVDHMCFVLLEENALFTGDNVLGHGYSVVQDLSTYISSLAYMSSQGCSSGYPAHGAKIDDLPKKMMEYRNHKELRINKIFTALQKSRSGQSGMTLVEIVNSIYGNMPEDVLQKALIPFLRQALTKLTEDRKIGFQLRGTAEKRYFACTLPEQGLKVNDRIKIEVKEILN